MHFYMAFVKAADSAYQSHTDPDRIGDAATSEKGPLKKLHRREELMIKDETPQKGSPLSALVLMRDGRNHVKFDGQSSLLGRSLCGGVLLQISFLLRRRHYECEGLAVPNPESLLQMLRTSTIHLIPVHSTRTSVFS